MNINVEKNGEKWVLCLRGPDVDARYGLERSDLKELAAEAVRSYLEVAR